MPPTTRKWSAVWEAQALLRADAVVGDAGPARAVHRADRPAAVPRGRARRATTCIEVRRIKARVDAERLPRGADPDTHLKLGRGGLSDVEWTVQLLQMRHAGAGARPAHHRDAGGAGRPPVAAGLLADADAAGLAEAWRLASRVRNAIMLVRGKAGDQLPRDHRERAAVAAILGYRPGESDEMVNDYLRTTRRARVIVDRIFWS